MSLYLVNIRALTVQQPWADAICHHGKRIENRTWAPPAGLRRMFIHAGKGWDSDGLAALVHRDVSVVRNTMPQGAIVAVVGVDRVCNAFYRGSDCTCGDWAIAGQYHWQLSDVRVLAEPVLCGGRQKLWRPDADVVAQVAAQVGGAS